MRGSGCRIATIVCVLAAVALAAGGCGASQARGPDATPAGVAGSSAATLSVSATPGAMAGGTQKGAMAEKTVAKAAAVSGGVQTISIDLSSESYVPNKVLAKAGVPLEMTFGQGKGCVKTLVFQSFGIKADMTKGPRTFKLPALSPGTYAWSCGMDMKHGVVEVR